ncbi:MAG: hypothetical protein JNN00_03860 [Chitinophagaceae bacterium]|nr:hypothetical protein [Chitinophagaceae bacterium]
MKRSLLFFIPVAIITANVNAQLKIDNATFFISAGATVTVQGDVTSNVDIQGTGVLQLKGTSTQNVDMGGFVIPNLEIDNSSANINLLSNARIGTSLLFTNGKAQLNGFDLFIANAATVSGASSSKFVITNGTGRLVKNSLGASSFTFPVGYSAVEFNPLTISNSGTADDIGVRCLQNVLDQGLTGSAVTADFANNSWVVTEAIAGGSNLSLAGEWAAGDELSNFNRVKSGIARYNTGTDWDLPASNVIAAAGSGPYNRSRSNITAAGVFAIADLEKVNAARLNLKVFLQGAYNSGTGLMNDLLRDDPATGGIDPVIPTTQPYNAALNARFTRVGVYDGSVSVNETVDPSVFNITGNNAIVDWVYVSTLDASSPSTKLQTRAALLQRDGDIVDVDGVSPLSVPIDTDGNYHFLISHRNHLSVRTPSAQTLADNAILNYDMTDAQNKAYQNGAIISNAAMAVNGSVYLMWAGNANLDDYTRVTSLAIPVVPSDAAFILGTALSGNPNATVTGYNPSDLNMDRKVRATSLAIPVIPSDISFMLGTPLNGDNNATRREHK